MRYVGPTMVVVGLVCIGAATAGLQGAIFTGGFALLFVGIAVAAEHS